MMKTFGMTMLVFGMFFAVVGCDSTKTESTVRAQQASPHAAEAKTLTLDLGDGAKMDLMQIPAGTFLMGSPETEKDRQAYEVQHEVTISTPFYMGKYEVTQAQWRAIMETNPSSFTGDKCPVEKVSWEDCQSFCKKLAAKTGRMIRLPTEAEWEYACRAGTKTRFSFGDADSSLGDYAWCLHNSDKMTHDVGGKLPNAFGLYDMHGNVWEWCQDWYGAYSAGSQTDPTGPSSGSCRVLRGGGWNFSAYYCRSAGRFIYGPGFRVNDGGFRLALNSE